MSHNRPILFQSEERPPRQTVQAGISPEDERIADAVLRTVLYSDIFDYPLTPEEIAHYLINVPASAAQIRAVLRDPSRLDGRVRQVEDFVTLNGREKIIADRKARAEVSRRMWRKVRILSRILGSCPFVKMVAVTGALAMDNSNEGDDIDVLLVASPNRVWLARAIAVLLVYAGKLTPHTLCPNYVISEEILGLEPQSVYVGHEFVQMVPVYGSDVCQRMKAANPWVERILPNAGTPLHREQEYRPGWLTRGIKRFMEWLLSGRLGDRLEAWEMNRKILKFASKAVPLPGSVIFDRNQAKGHFDDHGVRISAEFQRRLEAYRL